MSLEIYLGSNTPLGFFSYFEAFIHHMKRVIILKGGPGCGKSTLMKKLAAYGESAGQETVWIYCSSDSDSLDGVFFPQHGILYVDGTAPHALEAKTPGACEMLLDLGQCFALDALSGYAGEIRKLNAVLSEKYKRCYTYLRSAKAVKENADTCCEVDLEKLRRRTQALAHRTIPRRKDAKMGTRYDIFLSGFTKNGLEKRKLPGIYTCVPVFDPMAKDGGMMETLADTALENGYTAYSVHDPYDPKGKPMHVLLPEIRLAFVSMGRAFGYENAPGRHIRLDARETVAPEKQKIRKDRKIQRMLEQRAQEALTEAKAIHDELEQIYLPHVDFEKVDRMTEKELEKLKAVFEGTQR